MKTVLLALLVTIPLVSTGCSAAAPTISNATGELTMIDIVPQPGTTLIENTVVESTLDYQLLDGDPAATYEIRPMFADKRGPGYTFTASDSWRPVVITEPRGRVELRYPILREWSDPRLARPVQIWFFIIERKNTAARVLARVGPFTYE